ncbi:hypothetical protein IW262DRAFT_1303061, partial [Armillaria fumosa]
TVSTWLQAPKFDALITPRSITADDGQWMGTDLVWDGAKVVVREGIDKKRRDYCRQARYQASSRRLLQNGSRDWTGVVAQGRGSMSRAGCWKSLPTARLWKLSRFNHEDPALTIVEPSSWRASTPTEESITYREHDFGHEHAERRAKVCLRWDGHDCVWIRGYRFQLAAGIQVSCPGLTKTSGADLWNGSRDGMGVVAYGWGSSSRAACSRDPALKILQHMSWRASTPPRNWSRTGNKTYPECHGCNVIYKDTVRGHAELRAQVRLGRDENNCIQMGCYHGQDRPTTAAQVYVIQK